MTLSATEIVTPPVRLSFPALFEKKPVAKGSDKEKYQASLLIPPDVDLAPFKRALVAALREKFGDKPPKIPAKNFPIKSCDDKELAGYEDDWHYINTSTNFQPTVVDQKKNEILDDSRIFAGCWCRFHLNAYAWDHPQGGKGVSFGLNAVQLVREDERLDGRVNADTVFEALEVDDIGVLDDADESGIDDLFE